MAFAHRAKGKSYHFGNISNTRKGNMYFILSFYTRFLYSAIPHYQVNSVFTNILICILCIVRNMLHRKTLRKQFSMPLTVLFRVKIGLTRSQSQVISCNTCS